MADGILWIFKIMWIPKNPIGIPLGRSVPGSRRAVPRALVGGETRFPVPWTLAFSKFSNGQIMSIQIADHLSFFEAKPVKFRVPQLKPFRSDI